MHDRDSGHKPPDDFRSDCVGRSTALNRSIGPKRPQVSGSWAEAYRRSPDCIDIEGMELVNGAVDRLRGLDSNTKHLSLDGADARPTQHQVHFLEVVSETMLATLIDDMHGQMDVVGRSQPRLCH